MSHSKSAIAKYLRSHGPSAGAELPRVSDSPSLNAVERSEGVARFNPAVSRGSGSSAGGVGQTKVVYYLSGVHDPEDVVREWTSLNPHVIEDATPRAFLQAVNSAGSDFKDVSKEVGSDLYSSARWADAFDRGGDTGVYPGETVADKLEKMDPEEVFGDDG